MAVSAPLARPITPPVATDEIADAAVTMPKIARAGATTGQVVKWNGIAWAPGPDNTGGTSDSARIAANSYKLEGKDTTAFVRGSGSGDYIQNQFASDQSASWRVAGQGHSGGADSGLRVAELPGG